MFQKHMCLESKTFSEMCIQSANHSHDIAEGLGHGQLRGTLRSTEVRLGYHTSPLAEVGNSLEAMRRMETESVVRSR